MGLENQPEHSLDMGSPHLVSAILEGSSWESKTLGLQKGSPWAVQEPLWKVAKEWESLSLN